MDLRQGVPAPRGTYCCELISMLNPEENLGGSDVYAETQPLLRQHDKFNGEEVAN